MRRYNNKGIDELAQILKNDGVISVPTDTVYGLCARINSKIAYEKLVGIKNRPNNKSFPIMCLDESQIKSIAIVNKNAEKLIHAFMPGPITLVLNKRKDINNRGDKSTTEIAIRMAPTRALRELIDKTGCPIFMTSANKSGELVCQSLDQIEEIFPDLDGILVGDVSFGDASTIIDCTEEKIKIQRQGPISIEQIKEVIGI